MSHNAIGLLKANGQIEEYGNSGGGSDTNFVGTNEEWEALSTAEQNEYDTMDITNDEEASGAASKDDITALQIIGTANNTGSTITSGTWFYLNGQIVKAKTDIANGATFTLNTNYEVKTIGAELAELNSNLVSYTTESVSISESQVNKMTSDAYVSSDSIPQDAIITDWEIRSTWSWCFPIISVINIVDGHFAIRYAYWSAEYGSSCQFIINIRYKTV